MNWHHWIGKPHVTGADPVVNDGCDCLIMVTRIREHLGLPAPTTAEITTLIALAQAEAYLEIQHAIRPHLIKAELPGDGAFTVFETPDQFGTAVMIDSGLLHVSHKRGVRWLPANALRKFNWYHWT
jgi:hypothetical protein